MRYYLLLLFSFLIVDVSLAQDLDPAKWKGEIISLSNNEYNLIFTSTIEDGWTVYSQKKGGDGPVPTSFTFEQNPSYLLEGEAVETGERKEIFDKVFGIKLAKFYHIAVFSQKVKVNDPTIPIKGYFTFMTCNSEMCLPPKDVNFVFDIKNNAVSIEGYQKSTIPSSTNETSKDSNAQGEFDSKRAIDPKNTIEDCGVTAQKESDSLLWIFIMGFLGGLVALLTPCVFPMIPLTVSYFTKSSKDRASGIKNALIYGLSIIVIYVTIGIVITSIFGPTILNEMSTDMYFNLLFFVVFVIFAGSFFGYYEITLPSSWANKSDSVADKGGLLGIFFMAFTLSLVSFSCTGPIIGTLLVQAVQNASDFLFGFIPIKPLIGMLGFAVALALPFGLFAAFPSWLNSLPKSGSWMTNVKVTLGFLELALALKFLSTADMVRHWEFLKYELFIGIWILLFLGLALYQFGFIRFAHDGPLKKITTGRWIVGLLSLAFVGYMSTGFYKPLSLLSGLAPPVHYSWWGPKSENHDGPGCPHGLDCYHDFDEAVKAAKEKNKPIFVDFTGFGCVNCRKMEETVWVKPDILKHLKEDYVVVSLYVDDQERIFPDDKQKYLVDKNNGQKLRTKGSKWSSFEINNFGISSQPYYVLMANDGLTVLNPPLGGLMPEGEFKAFLQCGLKAFEKVKK